MSQQFIDRFKREIALLQILIISIVFLLSGAAALMFAVCKIEGFEEKIKMVINHRIEQGKATEKVSGDVIIYWRAPNPNTILDSMLRKQVLYGRELIEHTSKYLGPNGLVISISNGMNCQNCHLEAGTKVFGNNYGSVASTYPKFRARSGSEENIYKRVNDCLERSLNGSPLNEQSNEMTAIKAYIEFLGSNVPKGMKAEGSGLRGFPMLDRPADPERGRLVYESKCQSCHKTDGNGELLADSSEYAFPPLWGPNSYNDAAGLFRITNFARYVKYNMPQGADFEQPQLTDEEAWDVAAFVNSQPRPHKEAPNDWPDISKKPVDHPFGPYDDGFSEIEHKLGPFKPIEDNRAAMSNQAVGITLK